MYVILQTRYEIINTKYDMLKDEQKFKSILKVKILLVLIYMLCKLLSLPLSSPWNNELRYNGIPLQLLYI